MRIDSKKRQLVLSVGELARLIADSSSTESGISLNLRGRLGSDAHRLFQQSRSSKSTYQHEVHLDVSLPLVVDGDAWRVRLRGRIDGLIEELDVTVVEEIKTVTLSPERFANFTVDDFPRHLRQIELYTYLLSVNHPERIFRGRLVYINLVDNQRRYLDAASPIPEVKELVEFICSYTIRRELVRFNERGQKKKAASRVRFPFEQYRTGQESIVEAVAEAVRDKRHLLVEAPTGIGKTVAVFYETARFALEHDKQVFFLTAKTTQQDIAFRTARLVKGRRRFPRTLLLRARQKYCFLEEPRCTPEECPYLVDFQHRFRTDNILDLCLAEKSLHPDKIEDIGRQYTLCPHEIQLAILEDFDIVIGDYNYIFDPGCRLNRLFEERHPGRLILIVDEAHNLPDRAREYYSATLCLHSIRTALTYCQEHRLSRFIEVLTQIADQFNYYLSAAPRDQSAFPIQLSLSAWMKILAAFEEAVVPYWFQVAKWGGSTEDDPLLMLQKDLSDFVTAMQREGENFAQLVNREEGGLLQIVCLDASPLLAETFKQVHAGICMSATLQPPEAYAGLLGVGEGTEFISIASPFPPEHCRMIIDPSVTTIYRQREENVRPMADKIVQFRDTTRCRTLAFFPSFSFMRQVIELLPDQELYLQEEGMTDRQRQKLLRSFRKSSQGLLCAVMGGVFSEGIDLPGDLAEAAVIVGVGLPLVCLQNELIRAYYDRRGDDGFEYAYLFPGMRRVVQSVGRIIRSETDHGTILLLDQRFEQSRYQRLFPRHWYIDHSSELIDRDWAATLGESLMLSGR